MRAAVLALALLPAASFGAVTAEDLAEIRALIEREAMVKSASCPVYRPAAVRFRDLVLFGDDAVQQVQITERSGVVRVAYYALQRQQDGTWRASGCRVVDPARTISA
jgi:hypothetical protein